jgi:hypothetical protein
MKKRKNTSSRQIQVIIICLIVFIIFSVVIINNYFPHKKKIPICKYLEVNMNYFNSNNTNLTQSEGWIFTFDSGVDNQCKITTNWKDLTISITSQNSTNNFNIMGISKNTADLTFNFNDTSYRKHLFIYKTGPIFLNESNKKTPIESIDISDIHLQQIMMLENVRLALWNVRNDNVLDPNDYLIIYKDNNGDGIDEISPNARLELRDGNTILAFASLHP